MMTQQLNKSYKTLIVSALISILSFNSCQPSDAPPDVSDMAVSLEIQRFEQDLFTIDTLNLFASMNELRTQYPEILPFYLFNLQALATPEMPDTAINRIVKEYVFNNDIRSVFKATQKTFPALEKQKKELEQAVRYAKFYLPKHPHPESVFTFIAPFQHQAITLGETVLGLGLDMHLGVDYEFYAGAGHPLYQIQSFTPDYLVSHAINAYLQALLPEKRSYGQGIDLMIQKGKILFLLEKLLPETPKHILMNYTAEEAQWCVENEGQIWAFFINKGILFDAKANEFMRYTNPGPNSNGMPRESAGNTGSWTGWQIVRAFMANNPDVTIPQLLKMESGAKILKKSGYKPA